MKPENGYVTIHVQRPGLFLYGRFIFRMISGIRGINGRQRLINFSLYINFYKAVFKSKLEDSSQKENKIGTKTTLIEHLSEYVVCTLLFSTSAPQFMGFLYLQVTKFREWNRDYLYSSCLQIQTPCRKGTKVHQCR